ncbi:MAG TPA: DUF1674 domain-containing protein [Plasticicumulans sp.]|nr:DUF1674 domain-containing protein [Plasticicumulans sp.]
MTADSFCGGDQGHMSVTCDEPSPAVEPVPPAAPAGHPDSLDETPPPAATAEYGGRAGPEPTRYGDWEKNGRCIDF